MRTIDEIVRDLRTAAYAEGDGGVGLSDLADEIEAATKFVTSVAERADRDLAELNAENARLRASLKPVLDVEFRRVYGLGGYTVMPSKPLDDAVRDAKRIYNESEAK